MASGSKESPSNNPVLHTSPDEATRGYFLQQTMYRIKDPKVSLDLYSRVLGMSITRGPLSGLTGREFSGRPGNNAGDGGAKATKGKPGGNEQEGEEKGVMDQVERKDQVEGEEEEKGVMDKGVMDQVERKDQVEGEEEEKGVMDQVERKDQVEGEEKGVSEEVVGKEHGGNERGWNQAPHWWFGEEIRMVIVSLLAAFIPILAKLILPGDESKEIVITLSDQRKEIGNDEVQKIRTALEGLHSELQKIRKRAGRSFFSRMWSEPADNEPANTAKPDKPEGKTNAQKYNVTFGGDAS